MSLAQRSVRSSTFTIIGSVIQTGIQFIRTVLLARMLAPEDFGVYVFSTSFVAFTKSIPLFGLRGALLHRTSESEGESANQVHFTLTTLFTFIWALILVVVGYFYASPENRWVIWTILATQVVDNLAQTGHTILAKRVQFKRIALLQMTSVILSTATALLLAWMGYGIWSLVSTDIVGAFIPFFGYYIIKPVWRPRLVFLPSVYRYFLVFGRKTFLGGMLQDMIDNVDNLWTEAFLGKSLLGFYSRAYTFATYPRRVLSVPLSSVSVSTFAELKGQRKRLSQAFFRVNAFIIRTSFLFSGWLALIAPEFISLLIGVKWLPMLTAFRLMLIYTLLDPLKVTLSGVFIAEGEPEKLVRIRFVQFITLVLGLIFLGSMWEITGVALAVDIMIVLGTVLILWQVRKHVDFSIRQLFAVPTLALIVSTALARAAILIPGVLGSSWRTGFVKTVTFGLVYCSILLLLERKQIPLLLNMARHLLPNKSDRKDVPRY